MMSVSLRKTLKGFNKNKQKNTLVSEVQIHLNVVQLKGLPCLQNMGFYKQAFRGVMHKPNATSSTFRFVFRYMWRDILHYVTLFSSQTTCISVSNVIHHSMCLNAFLVKQGYFYYSFQKMEYNVILNCRLIEATWPLDHF